MNHDTDFFTWTQEQAALLSARRTEGLDWDNVCDEIESMGKSDRRQLESRLQVVLAHLLKWQAQPERRGRSWRLTLIEQRNRCARLLRDSPSLRATLEAVLADEWPAAVQWAMAETDLARERFPADLPWSAEQVIDQEFYP